MISKGSGETDYLKRYGHYSQDIPIFALLPMPVINVMYVLTAPCQAFFFYFWVCCFHPQRGGYSSPTLTSGILNSFNLLMWVGRVLLSHSSSHSCKICSQQSSRCLTCPVSGHTAWWPFQPILSRGRKNLFSKGKGPSDFLPVISQSTSVYLMEMG